MTELIHDILSWEDEQVKGIGIQTSEGNLVLI